MAREKPVVVTVADVARAVGVSPSSVSAVLSGRHVARRISAATVARVQAAAKKMRYVPNVSARSLRANATGIRQIVLTVMTSYEVPLFLVAQALRALGTEIERRAEQSVRYTVNIEMFHAGHIDELAGLRDGQRCNGAIITNTIDLDDQFLASTQLPFPVVMLGRRVVDYPSVSVRSEQMGRKAAEILLGIGRRKLAVLQPTVLTQATRSRLSAFVSAIEQSNGPSPMMINCEGLSEQAGYDAMQRFLAFNPQCDGIFAISDGLAIGAYAAIKKARRTIPKDIALVGIGDNPASHFIEPALTGFESAEGEQHMAAAKLLLNLVNGTPPENLSVEVPVTAILRGSTGHSDPAL